MRIITEKLNFPNERGESLAARLESPPFEPVGWAVFAHCFSCSKDIAAASRISRALAAEGWGVLRFDFTGLGNSDGDFSNTGFSSNIEDLEAACRHMTAGGRPPRLLVGHSLGGAAVLVAASRIEGIEAVCTIGAPYDPGHVQKNFTSAVPTIEKEGQAEVDLGGRRFTIRRQFLEDLASWKEAGHIGELRRPLLVFHSPQDSTVGVDNARRIFEAARHPRSFVSLDGADHLLTRREDAEYVGSVLATWVRRYLRQPADTGRHPRLQAGEVLVQEWDRSLTQKLHTPDHSFVADEPVDVGGHNKGPDPFALLLWALGACTNMTLRMYANRKQWPLDAVHVSLSQDHVHAEDCADCENPQFSGPVIKRRVSLEGGLNEEQQIRLLQIADRCPVHRFLLAQKKIFTEPG